MKNFELNLRQFYDLGAWILIKGNKVIKCYFMLK